MNHSKQHLTIAWIFSIVTQQQQLEMANCLKYSQSYTVEAAESYFLHLNLRLLSYCNMEYFHADPLLFQTTPFVVDKTCFTRSKIECVCVCVYV